MKLSLFLSILTISQLWATETYSQITKLTLKLEDAKISDVLREIENQSEFFFLYSPKLIDVERNVNVDAEQESIKDVLNNIFDDKVKYVVYDRQIILTSIEQSSVLSALQQQKQITGTITDKDGSLLPGVNVVVTGTTQGVTTDFDGKYSINVTPGSKSLTFSFIGMESQVVTIGTLTQINVTMTESAIGLDEVVVVGYGVQKRISLTSAVATVKSDVLTARTVSNIEQTLQGQIPGLTVIDNGGGPGRSNMVLRVRGITTLGSNAPLVIVDGIEQSFNDINPQDIETISVLKDASSTAIYGSRAANGVVLITTKRAKPGKLSVSYNSYYALQRSNNNPVHMGLEDYMRMQNAAWINSSGNPIYTEDYIKEYIAGAATDPFKYPLPNTWFDAVLHAAPQFSHSLSIMGGNETIKSVLSLRYQDQEGIMANSNAKIAEVRLNNDYKISPKVNIGLDFNYRNKNILRPIDEGSMINVMLQTSQWTVPKYPDGTYGISSDGHNPLLYSEIAGTAKFDNSYFTGILKGDWEILKGLKFSTQLSANMINMFEKYFNNSYEVRDYYNPDIVKKSYPMSRLTEARNYTREYTIYNLLNYSNTFGDHFFNTLVGYSQIKSIGNNLSAFRQDFYNNDIQSISQGANDATKSNSGNEYSWGLRSYFGRFNYSFQNKYLFEANGRYDGSSRFTGNNRYSFFPSFSAGWRISQERFWTGLINRVNELKLRASWGQTGNQAVSLYSYLPTLNLTNYSFNGVSAPGYRQVNLANDKITWETTTQSNIGLDAQFLDNRISFTVDYYYKRTADILLSLPVPYALGLGASPQNAGIVDNKGWEFLIGTKKMFGQLGVNINLNLSINNNKVIDLAGTGPYITGDSEIRYITGEGYPYLGFWGYETDGLFQTDEEVSSYPTYLSGTAPGDVKYVDRNHDDEIDSKDMIFLGGSQFPKYTFASDFNLSYKNFTLSFLFQGVAGAKRYIGGAIMQMGIWGGFTHEIFTNNYWTSENPNARFPRPTKYEVRNTQLSDRNIQDGAYLRLKNIQLKYQIPSSLTKKLGIQVVSIYVASTNLLTFSALNEWNVDPESDNRDAEYNYPQTSVTTLGLNINF